MTGQENSKTKTVEAEVIDSSVIDEGVLKKVLLLDELDPDAHYYLAIIFESILDYVENYNRSTSTSSVEKQPW